MYKRDTVSFSDVEGIIRQLREVEKKDLRGYLNDLGRQISGMNYDFQGIQKLTKNKKGISDPLDIISGYFDEIRKKLFEIAEILREEANANAT